MWEKAHCIMMMWTDRNLLVEWSDKSKSTELQIQYSSHYEIHLWFFSHFFSSICESFASSKLPFNIVCVAWFDSFLHNASINISVTTAQPVEIQLDLLKPGKSESSERMSTKMSLDKKLYLPLKWKISSYMPPDNSNTPNPIFTFSCASATTSPHCIEWYNVFTLQRR